MRGEKGVKTYKISRAISWAKIFECANHLYDFILIYTSIVNKLKLFTFLLYTTVSFYPIFCNDFLAQV